MVISGNDERLSRYTKEGVIIKVKRLFVYSAVLLSLTLVGCQLGISSENPKAPYPAEKAIQNGDIVSSHGEISNLDKFTQFIENMNKGVKDHVRITMYTDEGDPIFYYLDYDGNKIQYTYDATHDRFGGSIKESTTCSKLVSAKVEKGVEYHFSNCSTDIGNNFIFRTPQHSGQ